MFKGDCMNSKFDFLSAKNKHLQWKIRLRSFLDGQESMTLEQATSHKDCDLGKWLYAEGLAAYSQYPDMAKLEKIHTELHKVIKDVVTYKHDGQPAKAEVELAKVNTISSEIVGLLDKLGSI